MPTSTATLVLTAVGGGATILDLRSYHTNGTHYGTYITEPEKLLEVGATVWEEDVVESLVVHGDYQIGRRKIMSEASCAVMVEQATHSALSTHVGNVITAFSNAEYELRLTLDGSLWAWRCRQADYNVTMDRQMWHGRRARVDLKFKRHPIAVAGPF